MRGRRRPWISALLVALVAATLGPARAQPAPPGATAPTRSLGAAAARVSGSRLLLIEPDRRAVAAYDVASGAAAWRTPLASLASAHELAEIAPGRLLVHTERELVVLDVASGAIVAHHPSPDGAERAFLWQNDGACALRATCELWLVDCQDARPFGARLQGREVSRMRFDRSGWDSGCWGFSPDLVGRGGPVVVVSGDDSGPERGLIGVDVASGRRLWRRDSAARSFSGGASPDGSLCWVIDGDEVLRAFECRSGRSRFTVPHVTSALWSAGPPAGLFALGARSAVFLDARRGRRRWEHRLGANEVALVAGALLGRDVGLLESDHPRTLSVLAPGSGAVTTQVTLARSAQVVAGSAPGAWRVTGSAREIDPTGVVRDAPPDAYPLFEVERGPANAPATVFQLRPTRRPVLRLPSDAWSLGEHTEAGTTYLALFVWNPDGPGEVRILSAPRP